jgi:hypothetical protein
MSKTPMIIVKADIEAISEKHFIGRLQNMRGENMKGMIVEAETKDEVKRELLTSFKVKIAYDYGLEISMIECAELSEDLLKQLKEKEKEKDGDGIESLSITLV